MTPTLWIQLGVLVLSGVSLVMHASAKTRDTALASDVDEVKQALAAIAGAAKAK
jgi:hypothetical protein